MSSHGIVGSKDDEDLDKLEGPAGEMVTITTQESSEAECVSNLTQVTSTSDGTSIDVHQLPVSDIYTVGLLASFYPYFKYDSNM